VEEIQFKVKAETETKAEKEKVVTVFDQDGLL
jgi:hypothetical protein